MSEPRRFVIGDIHGCLETFRSMVEEVLRIEKEDTLFLLGDYIDRGPQSKGVIDFILELQKESFNIRPIIGNHEFMLLRSIGNQEYFHLWRMNGCEATLLSFGVPAEKVHEQECVSLIPGKYIRFFEEIPFYEESGGYLLVHAGVPPGIKSLENSPETILWTRDETCNELILENRKMIHGHTPVPEELIRKRIKDPGSRIYNLDAGCVYNYFPGLGKLAALDLDSLQLYFLRNRDS